TPSQRSFAASPATNPRSPPAPDAQSENVGTEFPFTRNGRRPGTFYAPIHRPLSHRSTRAEIHPQTCIATRFDTLLTPVMPARVHRLGRAPDFSCALAPAVANRATAHFRRLRRAPPDGLAGARGRARAGGGHRFDCSAC